MNSPGTNRLYLDGGGDTYFFESHVQDVFTSYQMLEQFRLVFVESKTNNSRHFISTWTKTSFTWNVAINVLLAQIGNQPHVITNLLFLHCLGFIKIYDDDNKITFIQLEWPADTEI